MPDAVNAPDTSDFEPVPPDFEPEQQQPQNTDDFQPVGFSKAPFQFAPTSTPADAPSDVNPNLPDDVKLRQFNIKKYNEDAAAHQQNRQALKDSYDDLKGMEDVLSSGPQSKDYVDLYRAKLGAFNDLLADVNRQQSDLDDRYHQLNEATLSPAPPLSLWERTKRALSPLLGPTKQQAHEESVINPESTEHVWKNNPFDPNQQDQQPVPRLIGESDEDYAKRAQSVFDAGRDRQVGGVDLGYKPLGSAVDRQGFLFAHDETPWFHLTPQQITDAIYGKGAQDWQGKKIEPGAAEKIIAGISNGLETGVRSNINPLALIMTAFSAGSSLMVPAVKDATGAVELVPRAAFGSPSVVARVPSIAFAADQLSKLPDIAAQFGQALGQGDYEKAAEALTTYGVMGYFGVKAMQHGLGTGIANESPMLRKLLTTEVSKQYTAPEIKDMFSRVAEDANNMTARNGAPPKSTPAEQELVKFLYTSAQQLPGDMRQGLFNNDLTVTELVPKMQNPAVQKFLGLDINNRRVSIAPSTPEQAAAQQTLQTLPQQNGVAPEGTVTVAEHPVLGPKIDEIKQILATPPTPAPTPTPEQQQAATTTPPAPPAQPAPEPPQQQPAAPAPQPQDQQPNQPNPYGVLDVAGRRQLEARAEAMVQGNAQQEEQLRKLKGWHSQLRAEREDAIARGESGRVQEVEMREIEDDMRKLAGEPVEEKPLPERNLEHEEQFRKEREMVALAIKGGSPIPNSLLTEGEKAELRLRGWERNGDIWEKPKPQTETPAPAPQTKQPPPAPPAPAPAEEAPVQSHADIVKDALKGVEGQLKELGGVIKPVTPDHPHYEFLKDGSGIAADIFNHDEAAILLHPQAVLRNMKELQDEYQQHNPQATPEQVSQHLKDWISRAANEEIIHLAQRAVIRNEFTGNPEDFPGYAQEYFRNIFNDMTPEQMASTMSLYLGRPVTTDRADLGKATDEMGGPEYTGLEFIRQLVQERGGGMTEALRPNVKSFLQKVMAALKEMLGKLRDKSTDVAKSIADSIANVEAVLRGEKPAAPEPQPEKTTTTKGGLKVGQPKKPTHPFNSPPEDADGPTVANFVRDVLVKGETIQTIKNSKLDKKQLDEFVELGVTMAAKEIIKQARSGGMIIDKDGNKVDWKMAAFNALVDLYNRQPNLNAKTSTSKINQAYSTPAPLAFAAQMLADVQDADTVYEPTGGNGMLLTATDPKTQEVQANEIDPERIKRLKMQGYDVVEGDATRYKPFIKMDAIVMNPPFGSVVGEDGKKIDWQLPDTDSEKRTKAIDHVIALQALRALKPDGKAVLILGSKKGTDAQRAESYRQDFYHYLYKKFNVVDHFTLNGDLYKKQGAGWPVDVVVIHGVGKSALPLPATKVPPILNSWNELEQKLTASAQAIGATQNSAEGVKAGEAATTAGAGNNAEIKGATSGNGGNTGLANPPSNGDAGGTKLGLGSGQPREGVKQNDVGSRGGGIKQEGGRGGARLEGNPQGSGSGGATEHAGRSGRGELQEKPQPNGGGGGVHKNNEQKQSGLNDKQKAGLTAAQEKIAKLKASLKKPAGSAPIRSQERELDAEQSRLGMEIAKDFVKAGNSYQEYHEAMLEALPEIEPYFRMFYEAARYNPELKGAKLTPANEVDEYLAKRASSNEPVLAPEKPSAGEVNIAPEPPPNTPNVTTLPPNVTGADVAAQGGTEFQVPYKPYGSGIDNQMLTPANLEAPTKAVMDELVREVGDVDDYLAKKLQRTKADVQSMYFGHQADIIALAIRNHEKGDATIVGDATGAGKGRVVAALMRYAKINGLVPVFVTAEKSLYSAMLTDLAETGNAGYITPFITDSGMNFDDEMGRTWKTGGAAAHNALIENIVNTGQLPVGHDAIFTTHAQIGSSKQKGFKPDKKTRASMKRKGQVAPDGPRMAMLRKIAPNAFFIIDEAHESAGDSARGIRMKQLLDSSKGVVYASATWAKNPTAIPVYFKTAMRHAGLTPDKLAEIMTEGGVPMQSVVSNMLAQAGGYRRVELSFQGIKFNFKVNPANAQRDIALADTYKDFMNQLLRFSGMIAGHVGSLDDQAKDNAEHVSGTSEGAGVDGYNFGQRLHQFTQQYVLALKADTLVKECIDTVKAGKKAYVILEHTMGGPLKDMLNSNLPPTFSGILLRQLDKIMTVKRKVPGKSEPVEEKIDPADLSDGGRSYYNLLNSIKSASFGDMPVSPIDYMRQKLAEAGIKTGELTGRRVGVDDQGKPFPLAKRGAREDLEIRRQFNNENLDVLFSNKTTGFSVHASSKFKNKKQRVGIVAEMHGDINKALQSYGRVNRAGQVVKPEYLIPMTVLPSEKRLGAIHQKKLASLNASTTSNDKSAMSGTGETPDLFNKYGDEVLAQVLKDNPSIAMQLTFPGLLSGVTQQDIVQSIDDLYDSLKEGDEGGFVRKITGYASALPIEDEQRLWDEAVSAYNAKVELLTQLGENELAAQKLDYRAKTLSSEPIFAGAGDNVFAGPANLERVKIESPKLPLSVPQIEQIVQQNTAKVAQDYAEWEKAFEEYKAQDLATRQKRSAFDAESQKLFDEQYDKVKFMVQMAKSDFGKPVIVSVGAQDSGQVEFGIISGMNFNPAKPKTLSEQSLVIHVNTVKQKIAMPLSQLSKVKVYTLDNKFAERYANTADHSTERWIVTGNLLGGMDAISKFHTSGKIITYTDETGATRTGIQLPNKFVGPQMVPVNDIDALENAIKNHHVTSPEGVDIFERPDNGANRMVIKVPASKVRGGKFWQDPKLNLLLENHHFVQSGSSMVGYIADATALENVFDRLTKDLGQRLSYADFSRVKPPEPVLPPTTPAQQPPAQRPAPAPLQYSVGTVKHENGWTTVEISFSGKPDEKVRSEIKSNGFRWNADKKMWWIGVQNSMPERVVEMQNKANEILARHFPRPAATAPIRGLKTIKRKEDFNENDIYQHAAASASDLNESLERAVTATPGVSNKVRSIIGLPSLNEVAKAAAKKGFHTFDDALAGTHTVGSKNIVALTAYNSLLQFQRKVVAIRERLEKQNALVKSGAFTNRVLRMNTAEHKADLADQLDETFRNLISGEMQRITHNIAQKGKTEGEIIALQEQYDKLKKYGEFGSAIKQNVDAIINALSADKDGRAMLIDGKDATGQELVNKYKALGAHEINPNEPWLMQTAAKLLAMNRDMALKMSVLHDMLADDTFAKSVNAVAQQFMKDYGTNPKKAFEDLFKKASLLGTAKERAQAAFIALQKQVMPEMEKFANLSKANEVITELEKDPHYRDYINKVYGLVGGIKFPDNLSAAKHGIEALFNEHFGNTTLISPDGKAYNVRLGYTPDSTARAQVLIQSHVDDIDDWLNDPDNAQSPERGFWKRQREFVQNTLNVTNMLAPAANRPLWFKFSWWMPDFLFKSGNLPHFQVTYQAALNFDTAFSQAYGWGKTYQYPVVHAVEKAARAHGYNTALGMQEYRQDVFNELAYHYRNGKELHAGDQLDNGIVLKQTDIDALKTNGDAINALYEMNRKIGRVGMENPMVVAKSGGVYGLRKAMELAPVKGTTLPHSFSREFVQLATSFHNLVSNGATPQDIKDFFDRDETFNRYVKRFVAERSSSFSTLTPFENLYRNLADDFRNGVGPGSIDEIVDYLEANNVGGVGGVPLNRADCEKIFMDELTGQFSKFYKNYIDKKITDVSVQRVGQENPMTRGFERDIGPSYFYDYGATTAAEVVGLGIDSVNFYLERYGNSLKSLEQDLKHALAELPPKSQPEARAKFLKDADARLQAGKDFRAYDMLERQLTEVRSYIATLGLYQGESAIQLEGLSTPFRIASDIIGNILSNLVTTPVKIMFGSPQKMGMTLSAMERYSLLSYPKAATSMAMSAMKVGSKALWNAGAASISNLPEAARAALSKDATGFTDRVARALEVELEGITDGLWNSSKFLSDQMGFGLINKDPVGHRMALMLKLPYSRGKAYNVHFSDNLPTRVVQKALLRGVTAVELATELPKAFLPSLPYAIAYDAAARQAGWSIDVLEAQARRAFDVHEKLGTLGNYDLDHPANPKNQLPPEMVLPDSLLSKKMQTHLNSAAQWVFQGTGLSLNDQVIRFWKKLSTTPVADRGDVHLFSAEENDPALAKSLNEERAMALMHTALKDVHHASALNRAMILRRNPFLFIFNPIMGWALQSARQWFQVYGRAYHDPQHKINMLRIAQAIAILAGLVAGTATHEAEKETISKLAWWINRRKDTVKSLAEAENMGEMMRILASDATGYIPQLNTVVNSIMGEKSHRGSASYQPFMIQQANAWLDYFRGIYSTKDITYGAAKMLGNIAPWAQPVLARTESQKGLSADRAAVAVLQKNGPADLIKSSGPSNFVPTELTPYRDALKNAVYSGDVAKAQQAYDDLVNKARELGRPDPEKLAQQLFSSINPYRQAFGQTLSEMQREALLAKLNDEDRGIVTGAEQAYKGVADILNRSAALTKEEQKQNRSVRVGGGSGQSSPSTRTPSSSVRVGGSRRSHGGRSRSSIRLNSSSRKSNLRVVRSHGRQGRGSSIRIG